MGNLLPKILGWLTVIITLALAPTINTQNAAVDTALTTMGNSTLLIGMDTVIDFGAPLMIIGLLFAGGMLAAGRIGDGSIQSMLGVIGSVIATVIALTMFESVITYVEDLVEAVTGFAQVIYGVIPIILYLAIVAGAGVYAAVKGFGGKKSKKASKAYNY